MTPPRHGDLATSSSASSRTTNPQRRLLLLLAGLVAVAVVAATAGLGFAARPPEQPADRWTAERGDPGQPTAGPREDPPARPYQPPHPLGIVPEVSPPPPPPAPDPSGEFAGWAVLDLTSGAITGSENLAQTSTTASMIKAWIVADYLRLTAAAGQQPEPDRRQQLSEIIRDSHNEYTTEVFHEIGAHASIERLIDRCGLTDSSAVPNRWSNTRLSPRDTARMGACLADGRAAGPEWTDWVLDEMRAVRGIGDFGIRHAFPADQRASIAIKNGWVPRDAQHEWHVNCLAIGDGWAMGVMTRYPTELGYEHGAEICRSLAAEHLLT